MVLPYVPKPSKTAVQKSSWTSILLNGRPIDTKAHDYHRSGGWSLGYHTGEDFSAKTGTLVRTPMSGQVVDVGYEAKGLGNFITVRMADGNYIVFGHLSKVSHSVGARLPAGAQVGVSGWSGNVRPSGPGGAHLHVEIRTAASRGKWGAGNFMDPIKYLNEHAGGHFRPPGSGSGGAWVAPSGGTGGGSTSTSTSTSTTSSGGGGIKGVGGFSKKDYLRWLDAKFGSIATLRQLDAQARKEVGGKSIDWLVDTLAKEKITDESIVASYMAQTGWFKKYGAETSLRLVAEKNRPAYFAEQVKNQRTTVDSTLDALGFHLSDKALNQLARDSYIYGWDVNRAVDEAQQQFAATGDVTYDGGAIGEAQDDLQQAAWALGVELTAEDVRQMRIDIINGEGVQSQLDMLRERSANMYTVYADQIRAGQSLRQVAGGYFQKMADMLELGSPDDVEMSDPLMAGGKAFMTADPATGKMIQKGMWDFEKDIRKDNRWLQTGNARQTMHESTGKILSLMGMG